MRTQLDRLTDQQRSIQAELEQAERELAQKREEAKSRKKLSGIAPQKGNISELQTQMNLIRQKTGRKVWQTGTPDAEGGGETHRTEKQGSGRR